jgi:predicted cobalt transporter CbtA
MFMTAAIFWAFPVTEDLAMVGRLLLRGMLAGVLAGVLAAGFAFFAGESSVDRAIAFESAAAQAAGEPEEPEIVSREIQRSAGLLTAGVVYGAALGGFFALAFAFANGRIGGLEPRAVAALLALAGFIAIALVPALKYPANPPSIGQSETIGARTAFFFTMLLASVLAMILASLARGALLGSLGAWNAGVVAGAAYVVAIVIVSALLPSIDEVPERFPADLLWRFRLASLGAQAVLWSALGLTFGALAQSQLNQRFSAAASLSAR